MDPSVITKALEGLLSAKNSAGNPWEASVVSLSLSLISRKGTDGVAELQSFFEGLGSSPDSAMVKLMATDLTLRESSDLLVVMQNREADRVAQTRDLLHRILLAAKSAAEILLKSALEVLL